MADFAKAIKSLLVRAKEDPENTRLFGKGRKQVGTRSVEALLQIATDSGSEVTLRHFVSSKETIEIQVTPLEALKIREAAEAKRLANKSNPPILTAPGQPSLVIPDFSSSSFARALADYSGAKDGSISADVRMVIRSMIRMLRKNGVAFMIEGIAEDLQEAGNYNLAYAVRQEAARG